MQKAGEVSRRDRENREDSGEAGARAAATDESRDEEAEPDGEDAGPEAFEILGRRQLVLRGQREVGHHRLSIPSRETRMRTSSPRSFSLR